MGCWGPRVGLIIQCQIIAVFRPFFFTVPKTCPLLVLENELGPQKSDPGIRPQPSLNRFQLQGPKEIGENHNKSQDVHVMLMVQKSRGQGHRPWVVFFNKACFKELGRPTRPTFRNKKNPGDNSDVGKTISMC